MSCICGNIFFIVVCSYVYLLQPFYVKARTLLSLSPSLHVIHLFRVPIFLKLVFFSSLALTASSPVDTSPSSDLPSSSSPSFTPSSSSNTNLHGVEAEVRLLPPLLKDQAWGVHAQEAFLLFCLALGECCLPQ